MWDHVQEGVARDPERKRRQGRSHEAGAQGAGCCVCRGGQIFSASSTNMMGMSSSMA